MSADVIPEDLRVEYEALTTRKILLSNGTIVALIERIGKAEADLALWRRRAEWQEITPENLPKVGDEVGCFDEGGCVIYEVGQMHTLFTSDKWRNERAVTHFRAINPPEPR